jgi:hypothetical protein
VSSREVEFKAVRYLTQGRLRVTEVVADKIRATCRGSSNVVYDLGFDMGQGWWCRCPARVFLCCHIAALQKVVDDPAARIAARRSA